jgi:hypothetical protein
MFGRMMLIGAALTLASFAIEPAAAQNQPQVETKGAPGSAPAAKKKSKRAIRTECRAQARADRLRGRKRAVFLRECMAKS